MPENIIDRKLRTKYAPELALRICELVADGETLVDIGKMQGMPNRQTIHRWLAVYPKFFDAYERAREVSAQSFEEEALLMARALKGQNDFTGTKVQAYNIAMQQLRWSASRRDKARYGQQQNAVALVPIQINTTLNLGQAGMGAPTDTHQSVYTIEATANAIPAFTDGYDEDTVDRLDAEAEVVDLQAEGDENELEAWGVPETEEQQLHNPSPGRPSRRKKGHKPPGQTANTARRYAAAEQRRLAKLTQTKED
jgi:hypothetical protein